MIPKNFKNHATWKLLTADLTKKTPYTAHGIGALGHCSRFGDIWHRRIQKVGSSIALDAQIQEALLLESPPGVLPIIVGDQHLENFIDHTVGPSGISGGQQWKFAWGIFDGIQLPQMAFFHA